jgi:hypothetical protein
MRFWSQKFWIYHINGSTNAVTTKPIRMEQRTLINETDETYRGAEITLVEAAGSDANYGMPGVLRLQTQPSNVEGIYCH